MNFEMKPYERLYDLTEARDLINYNAFKAEKWTGTTEEEAKEFCKITGVVFCNYSQSKNIILGRYIKSSEDLSYYNHISPNDYVVEDYFGYVSAMPESKFLESYRPSQKLSREEIALACCEMIDSTTGKELTPTTGFWAGVEFIAKKYGIEIKGYEDE